MVFRNGQFYSALKSYLVYYLTWCRIQISVSAALFFFFLIEDTATNAYRMYWTASAAVSCKSILLRQEDICVPWGLPSASFQWSVLQFGFAALRSGFWFSSGQALLEVSFWATVETLCKCILPCAEQLREFSVNPVSLCLIKTPVYCQRCRWEPVTVLCCSVPAEPECWALAPN